MAVADAGCDASSLIAWHSLLPVGMTLANFNFRASKEASDLKFVGNKTSEEPFQDCSKMSNTLLRSKYSEHSKTDHSKTGHFGGQFLNSSDF